MTAMTEVSQEKEYSGGSAELEWKGFRSITRHSRPNQHRGTDTPMSIEGGHVMSSNSKKFEAAAPVTFDGLAERSFFSSGALKNG